MGAIDYLRNHGFDAKVKGNRLVVSPSSKLTTDVRRYIKLHRLELMAEVAANDGESRSSHWTVTIPKATTKASRTSPLLQDCGKPGLRLEIKNQHVCDPKRINHSINQHQCGVQVQKYASTPLSHRGQVRSYRDHERLC